MGGVKLIFLLAIVTIANSAVAQIKSSWPNLKRTQKVLKKISDVDSLHSIASTRLIIRDSFALPPSCRDSLGNASSASMVKKLRNDSQIDIKSMNLGDIEVPQDRISLFEDTVSLNQVKGSPVKSNVCKKMVSTMTGKPTSSNSFNTVRAQVGKSYAAHQEKHTFDTLRFDQLRLLLATGFSPDMSTISDVESFAETSKSEFNSNSSIQDISTVAVSDLDLPQKAIDLHKIDQQNINFSQPPVPELNDAFNAAERVKLTSSNDQLNLSSKAIMPTTKDALPDLPPIPESGLTDELHRVPSVGEKNIDPLVAKELIFNKRKELNINHFSGRQEQLFSLVSKYSDVKSKLRHSEEIIDLKNEDIEPRRDTVSIVKKLIPGVNVQIQKYTVILFDVNPYVRFKLNRRVSLSAGLNYRLAYSYPAEWYNRQRVYGPRIAVDYKFREVIGPVAYVELMNAPNRVSMYESINERSWNWSYIIGVKTSFKLFRIITANTQLLYSLKENYKSLYGQRISVRFGMEFGTQR